MKLIRPRTAASKAERAALMARLDAATDESFPDREKHIRGIAAVVLKARGKR